MPLAFHRQCLRIVWLHNCSVLEGVRPHLGNELAVAAAHGVSQAEWRSYR